MGAKYLKKIIKRISNIKAIIFCHPKKKKLFLCEFSGNDLIFTDWVSLCSNLFYKIFLKPYIFGNIAFKKKKHIFSVKSLEFYLSQSIIVNMKSKKKTKHFLWFNYYFLFGAWKRTRFGFTLMYGFFFSNRKPHS